MQIELFADGRSEFLVRWHEVPQRCKLEAQIDVSIDDPSVRRVGRLRSALAHRMRAIVTISVTRALPLTSPAYDDRKTEAELRRVFAARFRMLQPGQRFEE
jgi:hypothetical protein